jgi:hypothetical protein
MRHLHTLGIFVLFILLLVLYLVCQASGIVAGDSGDLVTAAATFGVPHPPGYPLYTYIGWVLTHIPFSTISWRVTLLSSVPHAVTAVLVYMFVKKLTKSRLAGFFSFVLLSLNYLYFYYSVTPEVFGLFDLFVMLEIYGWCLWHTRAKWSYFYGSIFMFALSLTHHHVMLFFVPAIAFLLWVHRKRFTRRMLLGLSIRSLLLISVGFLPYIYVWYAASGTSMIIWDMPNTMKGFIQLVTRADYGTFVSSAAFGGLLSQRLFQLKAFIQFVLEDVTWIGLGFWFVGVAYLYSKKRTTAIFLLIAMFFMGPGFLFYASFPLYNSFNLATYERFLLPAYVLLYIFLGIGIFVSRSWVKSVYARHFVGSSGRVLLACTIVLLLMYPSAMGIRTLRRFSEFSQDRTADNLAIDVLTPLPRDAILLLGRDTTLFSTQYMRYAVELRPDVAVLHSVLLDFPYYRHMVATHFPRVTFSSQNSTFLMSAFITENISRSPIFSNVKYYVSDDWGWVPNGLMYELRPAKETRTTDEYIEINTKTWQSFHNPRAGILGTYNHLMLSDVPDVYAEAKIDYGVALLGQNRFQDAKLAFQDAIAYQPDSPLSDAYKKLAMSQSLLGQCDLAIATFYQSQRVQLIPDKDIPLYMGIVYRDCKKDSATAKTYFDQFDRSNRDQDVELHKLR